MIGTTVSHYKILQKVGAGGMGVVYSAEDLVLHRQVVIKLLPEELAEDDAALTRFRREARAASALNHPHICTVYELGEDGGLWFIVMELLDGQTLQDRILGGPAPLAQVVQVGAQVADALEAAHEAGIVHRDLKPANIFVTGRGDAKVLDFGLAKMTEDLAREESGSAEATTRLDPGLLTKPGTTMGTIAYMSPEQVRGEELDARTDLFSLGVVLYELATGRQPFAGKTAGAIFDRILNQAPAASVRVNPDLPGGLGHILGKALEKDKALRYQNASELRADLLRLGRDTTAGRPPPGPARKASGGSLPGRRTRFFGRERELEEIGQLLSDPAVRLLTLTGGGGTGKTRLALQTADTLAGRFEGRIVFVPLAGLSEADLIVPEISRALGAPRDAIRSPIEAIADVVEELGGPTLVILDGFDHLIEAAPLLGESLEVTPALTLLVTSREVLHIYGEHCYPVQPLPVPEPQRSAPLAELLRQPAVGLFVDRAVSARPSFRLDSHNAAAVVELCRRLDGLPLALELAAARVRMLSPKDLVARLGRRLKVLTRGARDLPERQRTLRGTIDWSHQLLDAEEQTVFRRLAVFPSGFSLEGAEAVVDPHGDLDLGIAEAIGSLVDKSLVCQLAPEGGPRFCFLETMHEYALERLEGAADEVDTRRAHAAYFLVLAEEGAAVLARGEDASWLATFAREHDNFLAALDWLAATDNAEWALRIALGVFPYWERGELFAVGARRLSELLELSSAADHEALRAKGYFAAGVLATTMGDEERAVELHRTSLRMQRALGDSWGILVALNGLSLDLADLGRFDEARSYQEQALALGAELGDDMAVARSLSNLARIAKGQGKEDEARRRYREAGEIFSRLEDRLGWAWSLNHEGDVARDQGDLAGATELYEQALVVFRELDDAWGIGSSLADLGKVRSREADWQGATDLFKQALRRFADLGHKRGVSRVLEQLSIAAVARGDGEIAIRLAAADAAMRERLGLKDAVSPGAKALEDRLARLSEMPRDVAERARREGEAMGWRAAVDYALEEENRSGSSSC
jgi:predicted ATPase